MNIGIVGGGQLGQMLAQAGQKLGHSFKFLVPPGECCVESIGEVIRSDFLDQDALAKFARNWVMAAWVQNVKVPQVWQAEHSPIQR